MLCILGVFKPQRLIKFNETAWTKPDLLPVFFVLVDTRLSWVLDGNLLR